MRKIVLALALLAAAGGSVTAQTFPYLPVRLVVGFPAGGDVDTAARVLAERMALVLGQTPVVENRPGAGAPADLMGSTAGPDRGRKWAGTAR